MPTLTLTDAADSLAGAGLQSEIIRCPRAFAALEGEYRDLYSRSSNASIYLSWPWIAAWWRNFGGRTTRLHILTFRNDGRLVGCAPFVVRRPAGFWPRRLEPMGVLRSDYMDLLIEDDSKAAVLPGFEALLRECRDWDLLDLQQLPEDSPTLAYFRSRQDDLGCIIREQEVCPYAPLPETWEAYLASLGKKKRYNVGYSRRLLERDFQVHIGRVDHKDLPASMEELFRLHQLRWRKRRLPGALVGSRVRKFHREVASTLMEDQQLDLYRLDLNGQTAAMLYCFAANGRGYYYLGGFDPDYARYSIGAVLTAYAIQQSIARRHLVFDFLRGAEPYKYHWNVQEKRNYRVEWLRGGPGSGALYALNEATRFLERQAKMLAHRLERSA